MGNPASSWSTVRCRRMGNPASSWLTVRCRWVGNPASSWPTVRTNGQKPRFALADGATNGQPRFALADGADGWATPPCLGRRCGRIVNLALRIDGHALADDRLPWTASHADGPWPMTVCLGRPGMRTDLGRRCERMGMPWPTMRTDGHAMVDDDFAVVDQPCRWDFGRRCRRIGACLGR